MALEKKMSRGAQSPVLETGGELTAVTRGEGCGCTVSNCLTLAGMVREALLEEAALKLNLAQ